MLLFPCYLCPCYLCPYYLLLYSPTASKTAVKPSFKEEIEKDWRLILHDDTVHTIAQVLNPLHIYTNVY
jgi:hypothetical protein